MATEFELKILTLNCWGIRHPPYPLGSKDCGRRITAIAKKLASESYDLIWSERDFDYIRNVVADVLPHAFYFHSGVCVFSRGQIIETLMHRYSLNGYPHHVHRGDWFGGKVVGLARILHNGIVINLYATHIHAEYDRQFDLYLAHRTVQAYELSQFVRSTSLGGDVSFAVGDFNLEPNDLGYRMVLANGGMSDAWIERVNKSSPKGSDPKGMTCDIPTNSYCSKQALLLAPEGKRIDHIMFSGGLGHTVTVEECYTSLGRIPGEEINFSDHEAVFAKVRIAQRAQFERSCSVALFHSAQNARADRASVISEAISVVENGLATVNYNRGFYLVAVVILLAVFFWTINVELHYSGQALTVAVIVTRFVLTLLIGFSILYGGIMLTIEQKALKAARHGMKVLLSAGKGE